MKHRTQLEQARTILRMLPWPDNTLAHNIDLLDEIVGRAQNGPPDGEADGSIDPPHWYALRDLVKAARDYLTAREAARIIETKR